MRPRPGSVVDLSEPWHEVRPVQVAMDGAALDQASALDHSTSATGYNDRLMTFGFFDEGG